MVQGSIITLALLHEFVYEIRGNNTYIILDRTALTLQYLKKIFFPARTAKTEEFMFQNVAYRPTLNINWGVGMCELNDFFAKIFSGMKTKIEL